jgi:hypothetical protein
MWNLTLQHCKRGHLSLPVIVTLVYYYQVRLGRRHLTSLYVNSTGHWSGQAPLSEILLKKSSDLKEKV